MLNVQLNISYRTSVVMKNRLNMVPSSYGNPLTDCVLLAAVPHDQASNVDGMSHDSNVQRSMIFSVCPAKVWTNNREGEKHCECVPALTHHPLSLFFLSFFSLPFYLSYAGQNSKTCSWALSVVCPLLLVFRLSNEIWWRRGRRKRLPDTEMMADAFSGTLRCCVSWLQYKDVGGCSWHGWSKITVMSYNPTNHHALIQIKIRSCRDDFLNLFVVLPLDGFEQNWQAEIYNNRTHHGQWTSTRLTIFDTNVAVQLHLPLLNTPNKYNPLNHKQKDHSS